MKNLLQNISFLNCYFKLLWFAVVFNFYTAKAANNNFLMSIYESQNLSNKQIDSANAILKNEKNFSFQNIEIIFNKIILQSKINKYDIGMAEAKKNYGIFLLTRNKYGSATKAFLEAIKIFEKLELETEEADIYNQLTRTYIAISEVTPNENLASKSDITFKSFKNKELNQAEFYCRKAIFFNKQNGNLDKLASNYNNLGIIKQKTMELDSAEFFFKEAYKYYKKLGDRFNMANIQNNLGIVFEYRGEFIQELKSYQEALKLFYEISDTLGVAIAYGNIANLYYSTGDCKKGLTFGHKGLDMAAKSKNIAVKKDILYTLFVLYECLEDCDKKSYYFSRYIEAKDSIFNIESKKILEDVNAQYETEKKENQIILLNKNKELDSTIKKSLILGIIIVMIVVFIVLIGYSQKQNANELISQQKKEVELQRQILEKKNREITSSIEYALRIQSAILPPQKMIKQYLQSSFVLYLPKDIVAGDFYWMENVGDTVLFAACDCTGHGVPGAMVSVVCHNALNRAVREFGLIEPAKILDKTAELVIENFSKSEDEIKDGMDISLCAYNTTKNTMQYAGANNPLWIVRNGDLIETKANKQPIGRFENNHPFTNHEFELQKNDAIYIFTDGYADQFGGATAQKKLTKKRFKDLIIGLQNTDMLAQGKTLESFILEYMNQVEQVDDILVMGLKV
jgi:serine phosphatase RsbU (regulator of sigma subunit)